MTNRPDTSLGYACFGPRLDPDPDLTPRLTLQELGRDVRAMLHKGEDLTELPGIGDDLAGKIREIAETGRCAALDKLHKKLPPAIWGSLKAATNSSFSIGPLSPRSPAPAACGSP